MILTTADLGCVLLCSSEDQCLRIVFSQCAMASTGIRTQHCKMTISYTDKPLWNHLENPSQWGWLSKHGLW